jgi:hypothetical protein
MRCDTANCENTPEYLVIEVDESQEFLPAYSPDYWLVCTEHKETVSIFGNVLLISLHGLKELLA